MSGIRILGVALIGLIFTAPGVGAMDLKISERNKYYRINGKSAQDFALAMSRKGPYSRQHRRRAWATAGRELSFQLERRKSRGKCAVKRAKVSMEITYTLPKLRSKSRVPKRELKKWRLMLGLLKKHEQTHGRFYRELARKAQKSLRRLPTASSCRQLEQSALQLVRRLSEEDRVRNDRFDERDGRNYRRMSRLYNGS